MSPTIPIDIPVATVRAIQNARSLEDNAALQTALDEACQAVLNAVKQLPAYVGLRVKSFYGKDLIITLPRSSTVSDLKREIEKMVELPPEKQRLRSADQTLEDQKTLDDYGVESGSTIILQHTEADS